MTKGFGGLFGRDDTTATLAAISKSQAIIEFSPDGVILTANENFLNAMGYALGEIQGQHHRMFVDPAYAQTSEYGDFWRRLGRGEYDAAEYKRLGKGGREVWIQASYNPVFDKSGKAVKVVKIASDVTARKMAAADAQSQLAAISRAQAVIEFNLDGTIITANENFCRAMGYGLDEIKGRHHRMFCTPEQVDSEIERLLNLVDELLRVFGYPYTLELSTRPDNALGAPEIWTNAENMLARALERRGQAYTIDAGGGAFYGPKLDFKLIDAIGRKWQGPTVQLDFNLPERFALEYIGADNQAHRPVMLHRVLVGSMERFVAG